MMSPDVGFGTNVDHSFPPTNAARLAESLQQISHCSKRSAVLADGLILARRMGRTRCPIKIALRILYIHLRKETRDQNLIQEHSFRTRMECQPGVLCLHLCNGNSAVSEARMLSTTAAVKLTSRQYFTALLNHYD